MPRKKTDAKPYSVWEYAIVRVASTQRIDVRPAKHRADCATEAAAIRTAKSCTAGGLMHGPTNVVEIRHQGKALVPRWMMGTRTAAERGGISLASRPTHVFRPLRISLAPAWWIRLYPDHEKSWRRGPYSWERLNEELKYVQDVPYCIEVEHAAPDAREAQDPDGVPGWAWTDPDGSAQWCQGGPAPEKLRWVWMQSTELHDYPCFLRLLRGDRILATLSRPDHLQAPGAPVNWLGLVPQQEARGSPLDVAGSLETVCKRVAAWLDVTLPEIPPEDAS